MGYNIKYGMLDQMSGLGILDMKFVGNLLLNDSFTNNFNFVNC